MCTAAEIIKILTANEDVVRITAKALLASPRMRMQRRGHDVIVTGVQKNTGGSLNTGTEVTFAVSGERGVLGLSYEFDGAVNAALAKHCVGFDVETRYATRVVYVVTEMGFRVEFPNKWELETGLEVESKSLFPPDIRLVSSVDYRDGQLRVNSRPADFAKFSAMTVDISHKGITSRQFPGAVMTPEAVNYLRVQGLATLGHVAADETPDMEFFVRRRFVGDDITGFHDGDETYTHGDVVFDLCVNWATNSDSGMFWESISDASEVLAQAETLRDRVNAHTSRTSKYLTACGF